MATSAASAAFPDNWIDHSQYGQALLFPQLLTPDTPRILVDIGAHDGLSGSTSRNLLEQGWRGVLVEPVPSVFVQLALNSVPFGPFVSLVNAACSGEDGSATLTLGKGGPLSSMGSLSSDPQITQNLVSESIRVPTVSLRTVLEGQGVPDDFGILMVDAEGLDFTILDQLRELPHRPRIIVTEEFFPTDFQKYELLRKLGYNFLGIFGPDSFWMRRSLNVDTSSLRLPIHRLPDNWQPTGNRVEGFAHCDRFLTPMILGWAFQTVDQPPPLWVAVELKRVRFPARYFFRAHRYLRDDLDRHFGSSVLGYAGLRCFIDVLPSDYEIRIFQQNVNHSTYSVNDAGVLTIPGTIID